MRSPVERSAAGGPGPGRRQGTAAEDTASGVCERHPIEAGGGRVPRAVVIRTLGTDIGTLRTIIGTLGTDIGTLIVIKHPLIDGRLKIRPMIVATNTLCDYDSAIVLIMSITSLGMSNSGAFVGGGGSHAVETKPVPTQMWAGEVHTNAANHRGGGRGRISITSAAGLRPPLPHLHRDGTACTRTFGWLRHESGAPFRGGTVGQRASSKVEDLWSGLPRPARLRPRVLCPAEFCVYEILCAWHLEQRAMGVVTERCAGGTTRNGRRYLAHQLLQARCSVQAGRGGN